MTAAITSDAKFQEFFKPFVYSILQNVGWMSVGPRHSWDVEIIQKLCPRDEYHSSTSTNITILPIENMLKPWVSYIACPEIKRKLSHSSSLTPISLRRLGKSEWLNDDLIDAYIACMPLRDRVLVLNTSFVRVLVGKAKNLKAVTSMVRSCCAHDGEMTNFFSIQLSKPLQKDQGIALHKLLELYRFILFPYHVNGNHWITVCASYNPKMIMFMDSLPNGSLNHSAFIQTFKDTFKDTSTLDGNWKVIHKDVPIQRNTFDCGVYTSQFIKFLYLQEEIPSWSQRDIDKLRRVMALEIYEGSIRWGR